MRRGKPTTDGALAAIVARLHSACWELSASLQVRPLNHLAKRSAPDLASLALRRTLLAAADRAIVEGFEVIRLRAGRNAPVLVLATRRADLRERVLAEAAALWKLTPQKVQVLSLLAEGCAAAEIGERLGIHETTARNHINQLNYLAGCAKAIETVGKLLLMSD